MGFDLKDAASIGIIGAADGPTSILVSQVLKSNYTGQIAVAAYSYMALVPIVQPVVIKAVTTKKERRIKMVYNPANVTKALRISFPIIVTFVAGIIAPTSVALVGFLMFGNLLRECGVLNSLSEAAQKILANLVTLLLGITISFSMVGAAGISAFPMSSRVVQKPGQKEDSQNFLLMHAVGANVAGQIASVLAGGMILNLIPKLI